MKNDDDVDVTKEIAENIKFNSLKLQYKPSEFDFEEINFKTIYQINNLKEFWGVFQNVEFEEMIEKGSVFLSLKTPIWNPKYGTFSFIVSKSSNKTVVDVFTDICLFFIENQLNQDKKIEGVSLTLKGRERNIFNIKVTLNSQDENDINFESLPEYFGDPKFSLNCQRSITSSGFEMVKRTKQQQQRYPNKNYYNNNYHKKNKYNNKKSKKINNYDDDDSKPPTNPQLCQKINKNKK